MRSTKLGEEKSGGGGCCGKVDKWEGAADDARWQTGEEVVVIAVARNRRKLDRFTAGCDD